MPVDVVKCIDRQHIELIPFVFRFKKSPEPVKTDAAGHRTTAAGCGDTRDKSPRAPAHFTCKRGSVGSQVLLRETDLFFILIHTVCIQSPDDDPVGCINLRILPNFEMGGKDLMKKKPVILQISTTGLGLIQAFHALGAPAGRKNAGNKPRWISSGKDMPAGRSTKRNLNKRKRT